MTVVESSGIVRSSLLAAVPGVVHGFTTRGLGSMAGSLHPAAEQERNRRSLEREVGLALVKPSQVHGADVVRVENGRAVRLSDGEARPLERVRELEADAIITRERGLALSVAVADCVPVLVVSGDWIGAAHAGWEGATRGVVRALAASLGEARGERRAAIGPSIGPCCYDIDASRAALVRERLGRRAARILHERGDRAQLDLWLAVRLELADAGFDAVDSLDLCTRDEVARFFSHRGERGAAGRGLAFIGWSA